MADVYLSLYFGIICYTAIAVPSMDLCNKDYAIQRLTVTNGRILLWV
jgi:hypothetical protein